MLTISRRARGIVVAIGIASLVTAATGTGIAIAAARWNPIWKNGTIHQCLDNKTWMTRTLPSGKTCNSHETGFMFNQKGPQGLRGLPGTPGLGASVLADDRGVTQPPPADWTKSVIKQATIKTTQSGKLLLLDATVYDCTINNQNNNQPLHYRIGAYVDGVGVPGAVTLSDINVPAGAVTNCGMATVAPAVISGIPAGTHTVAIDLITSDTTTDYLTSGSGRLLVVATG
jgi:hypothetical protein